MDRELLNRWLEQGLSLIEIGALTARDPSTVGYWVKKHGLTANGKAKYAPRGGLTREQLAPLVEAGATLQEIADRLDRSTSTVRHWMARHGLKLAGHHGNRAAAVAALASGRSRFVGTCRRHGETEFLVFKSGRHRCGRCNSEAVSRFGAGSSRSSLRKPAESASSAAMTGTRVPFSSITSTRPGRLFP